jgi:hypothetical protein
MKSLVVRKVTPTMMSHTSHSVLPMKPAMGIFRLVRDHLAVRGR